MQIFDLHCDTAFRMKKERLFPTSRTLHINAHSISLFSSVTAVFAFWCDSQEDDEAAYRSFFETLCHFKEVRSSFGANLRTVCSVEDGRLLCGQLDRLDTLLRYGVRILTPFWGAQNTLGCGHSAQFDTGLSAFGEAVVQRCFDRGILCDISHASPKSAAQMLQMAKGRAPVLATHSNFAAICPHTRNLTDALALSVRKSGGLIGLSMVPSHLAKHTAGMADFTRHLRHAYQLGIEDSVCLGCDFDGTDALPDGVLGQSSLLQVADFLRCEGFSHKQIEGLFWRNAATFFENYFS